MDITGTLIVTLKLESAHITSVASGLDTIALVILTDSVPEVALEVALNVIVAMSEYTVDEPE